MNVKRFTGRTSREALQAVRQAFGEHAVVLSTKPCAEGVEVLAMASDGLQHIEQLAQTAPKAAVAARAHTEPRTAARAERSAREERRERVEPRLDLEREFAPTQSPEPDAEIDTDVGRDVERLAMSTLSFQDYVRERMLKRRRAAMSPAPAAAVAPAAASAPSRAAAPLPPPAETAAPTPAHHVPVLRDDIRLDAAHVTPDAERAARREQAEMMNELRAMKGLIEQRFGALAFMEKLQKSPAQATLSQKLLDAGFSPGLIRKLGEALPADVADPMAWAAGVLERNLVAAEQEPALEDLGGVFALIGSTGVGKTTTTAKIAAAFATRHGAGVLGLITLDAYRVGAHEQLRTYGRILGVPVHTAHDRASLDDLLDLLSGKKMVLIDTAGMAQRDSRTRELLDMLQHRSIQKLLVVNASAQGETIDDVLLSWRASACRGVVLSKIDEAVKLGPALDALIRHKAHVMGVANGQRVPEDWHRLSAQALVQRALRASAPTAWQMGRDDVNLVFAAMPAAAAAAPLHV
ncbi:flagellar biosynthesis protein FlhF [Azohydromonas sediminis]|uniref:flagellar biosynthesis protein FlhF n=1 Tax=Azohydromonas sediminis TaxID=2259674 RepID=UPI000E65B1DF|nr:flagellar biosynthesis protein FlhF [Azohydromonas sediminis]